MESKTCTASDAELAFRRLVGILDTLRRECPWDKVQTMKSLRYLTIEEVHELSEAIVALEHAGCQSGAVEAEDGANAGLVSNLKKELGDIAMHILFYCKIAEEEDLFSTADVYNAICDKLIDRHPFIYRKEDYHGESWEQLKMRERDRKGVLDGVPDSLPSMVKAVRMQEKVAGLHKGEPASGDDDNPLAGQLPDNMSEAAFGDLLFSLVGWAMRHGINADDALCDANRRFRERYSGSV